MSSFNSLEDIRRSLSATLGNAALFSLVNARLMLKTGVDLSRVNPEENTSTEHVDRVLTALQAMGYSKSTLQLVVQRMGGKL